MRLRDVVRAATCGFPGLAAAQGDGALSQPPDGIKLGLIFPDFSPNEFAGLGFVCTPGVETGASQTLAKGAGGPSVGLALRSINHLKSEATATAFRTMASVCGAASRTQGARRHANV